MIIETNEQSGEKKIIKVVNRTYSHFEYLFNELLREHPGFLIPSIPDKDALMKLTIDFGNKSQKLE